MSFWDRIRALGVLAERRLRTGLTLLGIVIGSGAIVLVAGLVHGAEVALVAANQSVSGSDLVQIRSRDLPPRERLRGQPELSRGDALALAASPMGRDRLTHSESSEDVLVENGRVRRSARIVSGTPHSLELFHLELARGRFIEEADLRGTTRVAVIGEDVWRDLFGGAPLTSATALRARGVSWGVVGVLKHKPLIGSTTGNDVWARKVIVPETTFDAVYAREHKVGRVVLVGERTGAEHLPPDMIRPAIRDLLLRRHQGAQNFKLDDSKARDLERTIVWVIGLLLVASGVLTLGTGAINVANVMFVSVAERTREIGLRRALGEPRRSILTQFLLEAAILGLFGGAVGVALGSGGVGLGGYGLSKLFAGFSARVEPWSVTAGFGLSVLAGLVAGLVPAMRAARLDPVVALRAE